MTKEELLKLVEIDEILQKIFDGTNTNQDLDDLLKRLTGTLNIDELKEIIKNCLNKKFDSVEKFKKCVLDNVALKNKLKNKSKNKLK